MTARPTASGPTGIPGLMALAFLGQVVVVALAVLLARRLSLAEFEAFAVAASVFIVMATAAPLGSEKQALRTLPPLFAVGDVAGVRAYLGFALRRCLVGVAAAILLCLLWIGLLGGVPAATRHAVLVACLSLPAGALVHLGLEVLSAAGHARLAAVVFRIVVPAVAAALLLALALADRLVHGAAAIGAWGIGWVVGLGIMLRCGPGLRPALGTDATRTATWRRDSRPLWLYRLASSLLAQAGIIALELAGAAPVDVGAYAAATSLVGFAAALVRSTNRIYAREIAICLRTADAAGIRALRRRRAAWLLPLLGLLLLLAFGLPDRLLALYRADFVEPGRQPLRLLASSAALSMALALAPTVLIFRGEQGRVLATLSAAFALQVLLLAWLVPRLGATGAAASHAMVTTLLYGRLAVLERGSFG